MKVVKENDLDIDNVALVEMVDAAYLNPDGTKKAKITKESARVIL